MKKFRFRNRFFPLSEKTYIMGIVNVTPDSFSDGGRYFSAERAIAHAEKLVSEGADIIDLGAMSTRPGSEPVSVSVEIDRLKSVVEGLASCDCVISVDTVNPETADYFLGKGVDIINDVSGIFNNDMADVVKKHSAGWIITHTCNVPSGTVIDYPEGVISSVNHFFDDFLDKCKAFGIDKEYICLDPGFGFAKTTADNVVLLKNLENVVKPDVAFMTALSKKRFIGEVTGTADTEERLVGTIIADLIAVSKGSDILRVHNVKETLQSIAIYNSIK